MTRSPIEEWTKARIARECGSAYRRYKGNRIRRYREYFERHPDLSDGEDSICALDLPAALPPDPRLVDMIDHSELHRWHLSGNSSQTLALGLLGSGMLAEPSLDWLLGALDVNGSGPGPSADPSAELEVGVPAGLLGERPRQTTIDFLVTSEDYVICLEAKWTEEGVGACRCPGHAVGECLPRVLDRLAYWHAAEDFFGLTERESGSPCPLHASYQMVRNAAAADALANGRTAIFALLYDAENPYFGATGTWPGWPAVISTAVSEHAAGAVHFASCSWQRLAPHIPLGAAAAEWAAEKHGLSS